MKLSLALFVLIALVVILYPEDSEASPARRRQQLLRGGRRNIARQARRKVVGRKAGRRARPIRRGRTNIEEIPDEPVVADDADVAVEEEVVEGEEAGGAEEEVPAWCDPADPMGAWLNFQQIRVICGDRGFSDFGPYGGIPAVEEGLDEEVAEAVEAGDVEAVEEVVEELERRRRRRRRRQFRARNL